MQQVYSEAVTGFERELVNRHASGLLFWGVHARQRRWAGAGVSPKKVMRTKNC
jgi:hypothetical protein